MEPDRFMDPDSFALANGRHRFLQLFLYLFILFMSRDERTTITQSNHSLGASLLLRGRHFAIPANKTLIAGTTWSQM